MSKLPLIILPAVCRDSFAAFETAKRAYNALIFLGVRMRIRVKFYTHEGVVETFTYIGGHIVGQDNASGGNGRERM